MLKVDSRVPALFGVFFAAAGCAAATTPEEGSSTGVMTGAGGLGIQGASPPSGSGAPTTSAGGSMTVTGSGGAVTGSGGTITGTAGAQTGTGGTSTGTGGVAGGAAGATGTGGASNTAGTGTTGTGGAAAGPCTVASMMSANTDVGGFVTAGTWHGYGFTAKGGVGTTITPADYAMLTANSALCACGTVKGTTDYSGTAMVGVNLNQEAGGMAVGTITPSGMGINVTVAGAGTTPLRLQIQGPMGDKDPAQRWCANLPAAGGLIPWGNFQFECWEGGKRTPFNGTSPIAAAMVQVPGGTTDISFNFCLTALAGG